MDGGDGGGIRCQYFERFFTPNRGAVGQFSKLIFT
jgi:hypothetical protein